MTKCDIHEAVIVRLDQMEKKQDKTEVILDRVRNRLPLWATMAIGALLGLIGYLAQ